MMVSQLPLSLTLLLTLSLTSAEPPVIPSGDYTAPYAQGASGGGGGNYHNDAPSGSGYNSNAAAYNAALDFNNNNQLGDGAGGYRGGQGQTGAPLNSYGAPSNDGGNGGGGHNHEEYGEPKAYEFGYQVKDDYTGTNYNRQEKSDGNQVTGSYRVALPDGRTQIVTYYADWQTGFHADVRYEGEAHYPETYNNNNNNQGYNYNNNNNNNYNNNNNVGYNNQQAPSTEYGTPNNNNANNNNYNNNYHVDQVQQVKDYNAAGQSNNNFASYNNNNNNYNNNERLDTYTNSGFGNKIRPNQEYGAP